MRKAILLSLLVFCADVGYAQKSVIDSLQLEIKKSQVADTNRLKLLVDLSFYYKGSNPGKGIETATEAIHLATQLHDLKHLSTAYNYMGLNYAAQGNDSLAMKYYQQCLSIRKQLLNARGIASALHNIGISYFNLSDYPQALSYQQQALEILKKLGDQSGVAFVLNSIGVIDLYLSDYPKALSNYLEALHIYDQTGDEQNKAGAYTNIGLVYDHMGHYSESLNYQLRALAIYKKYDDLYNVQSTFVNMGNTYDNSGKAEKALSSYHQALDINKKLGNNRGIASSFINSGIVYHNMGDYPAAMDHLKKALDLYEQLNDQNGMSIAYSFMASTLLKAPDTTLSRLGERPSQRIARSLFFQQKGLKLAQQTGSLKNQSDAWNGMSDIYKAGKDYNLALSAFKSHILLRDSIFNDENRSSILRMSLQYDFDKKEAASKAEMDKREILASAEIKRQKVVKNGLAGGAILVLVASVISFIFYKRRRDALQKQKEAEFKAQVAATEMKALRAQMSPHFIFNSLNSISDYYSRNDIKTANNYLAKFAKMIRMILENSEHPQISLATDLKALELYMQLESIRMNDKFTYEIKVDELIDQENTLVPPLILQPFVENSIWHGIALMKGKGKILVDIRKEEEMIFCSIEDNGIGRGTTIWSEPADLAYKSMGMRITQSRIDMMNKNKMELGEIELISLLKGMRVEVRLPLAVNF